MTAPRVPVVSIVKLCVSEASTSVKSALTVTEGPSSLAPPITAFAIGASFSPVMVIAAVWLTTPPLPSSMS